MARTLIHRSRQGRSVPTRKAALASSCINRFCSHLTTKIFSSQCLLAHLLLTKAVRQMPIQMTRLLTSMTPTKSSSAQKTTLLSQLHTEVVVAETVPISHSVRKGCRVRAKSHRASYHASSSPSSILTLTRLNST